MQHACNPKEFLIRIDTSRGFALRQSMETFQRSQKMLAQFCSRLELAGTSSPLRYQLDEQEFCQAFSHQEDQHALMIALTVAANFLPWNRWRFKERKEKQTSRTSPFCKVRIDNVNTVQEETLCSLVQLGADSRAIVVAWMQYDCVVPSLISNAIIPVAAGSALA